jgi:ubiquitin-protein ligase E3 A
MIRTIGSVFNNAESLMKSFRKSPLPQKKETTHWLEMDLDKDQDECDEEPMEASPRPSPFKLAPDEVTLDIDSVRRSFKELFSISELPFLHSMINAICMLSKSVEVDLRYYQPFEIDQNYLNIFLIILEIPDLQSTEFLESAFPKFCRALGCLPVKAQAKLCRVIARYPVAKLRDFLDNLQQLITVKTVSTEWTRGYCVNDDEGITGAAKVLKILFYACILAGRLDPPELLESEKQLAADAEDHLNELLQGAVGREPKEKNQPKEDPLGKELGITPGDCREPAIPWEDFKNDVLSDAIEMDKDYTYYKAESESKFTFMTHSFLLSTAVKSLGLYFDNRIRMMNERRTSLLQSLVRGSPSTPYLRLRIRRDHIIDDSLVSVSVFSNISEYF